MEEIKEFEYGYCKVRVHIPGVAAKEERMKKLEFAIEKFAKDVMKEGIEYGKWMANRWRSWRRN